MICKIIPATQNSTEKYYLKLSLNNGLFKVPLAESAETQRPFHLVLAQSEDHARIITVYQPDKEKWIDYRKRKE